jgi:hypothetical protein
MRRGRTLSLERPFSGGGRGDRGLFSGYFLLRSFGCARGALRKVSGWLTGADCSRIWSDKEAVRACQRSHAKGARLAQIKHYSDRTRLVLREADALHWPISNFRERGKMAVQ